MCGLVNTAPWSVYKWQRVNAEVFAVSANSTAPDSDSTGNKQGYFVVLSGKKTCKLSQFRVKGSNGKNFLNCLWSGTIFVYLWKGVTDAKTKAISSSSKEYTFDAIGKVLTFQATDPGFKSPKSIQGQSPHLWESDMLIADLWQHDAKQLLKLHNKQIISFPTRETQLLSYLRLTWEKKWKKKSFIAFSGGWVL